MMKKQLMTNQKQDKKSKQNYRRCEQTQRRNNNKRRDVQQEQISTLIQNCEKIIKQQEEYIEKLQKDNERKQSIIANLLSKKESINGNMKLKKSQFEEQQQINSQQVEKLSKQIMELHSKYQLAVTQKQNIQKHMKKKDKQIKELNSLIKIQKERQIQQNQQIQQYINAAAQLKLAYEAKIGKLLAEIRRKVQEDVQKSKSKNFQSQSTSQIQQIRRLETPIKNKLNQYQNHSQYEQIDSREKTVRNIRKNWPKPTQSAEKLKLMNTPYRVSTNFVTANYKIFQQETIIKKNDFMNKKMLNQIEDVQFMSDNEQSLEEEKNSTEVDTSGFEDISKRKQVENMRLRQGKISVQNIIKEFSKYYKQQTNETQKIMEINEKKTVQKSEGSLRKMNMQQILSNLNIKMKKFEDQSIHDI